MQLISIGAAQVRRQLTFEAAIALMRETMAAISHGETQQMPRQIIPLASGGALGVMAGSGAAGVFGSKLVSLNSPLGRAGGSSHQGVIVIFEPGTGCPVCVLDSGAITAIRTASASAVATDALASPDADHLAVLGCGEQAAAHIEAIAKVRTLRQVTIWGRSRDKADVFASRIAAPSTANVRTVATVEEAVGTAGIVCTTTSAQEPVLEGRWVRAGTHVNVVGSSRAGPAEIDDALVVRSRFFVDHLPSALVAASEFLRARSAGLIDDTHIKGEIGAVLDGSIRGRETADDVTIYKSLGHVAQDLATSWHLYERALQRTAAGAAGSLEMLMGG